MLNIACLMLHSDILSYCFCRSIIGFIVDDNDEVYLHNDYGHYRETLCEQLAFWASPI